MNVNWEFVLITVTYKRAALCVFCRMEMSSGDESSGWAWRKLCEWVFGHGFDSRRLHQNTKRWTRFHQKYVRACNRNRGQSMRLASFLMRFRGSTFNRSRFPRSQRGLYREKTFWWKYWTFLTVWALLFHIDFPLACESKSKHFLT